MRERIQCAEDLLTVRHLTYVVHHDSSIKWKMSSQFNKHGNNSRDVK